MKNNKAQGRALGKIILMGEHAVVYGQPAISIPFPALEARTNIFKREGPAHLDCIYYKDKLLEAPDILLGLSKLTRGIVRSFGKELEDFAIKIESTIPAERGIGSSAAVAIATIRALYRYFDQALSYEDLIKWASLSERQVHGNPSGIDSATIAGEKALYFVKDQAPETIKINIEAYLIVADSGRKGQTKEAVSRLRKRIDKNPGKGNGLIKELGQLTNLTREAIEGKRVEEIGTLMTRAHHILDSLGVSDEKLNSLVSIASENGALGAKLTGGGRGGSIIALASSKEDAEIIGKRLLENGAENTWLHNLRNDNND